MPIATTSLDSGVARWALWYLDDAVVALLAAWSPAPR
jgi:hypothetical protein